MKKTSLLTACAAMCVALCVSVGASAQSRVDEAPAQLTAKSKELTKALYWEQNPKTGKWVSRKHDNLKYYGEGISCPNYKSVFLGEYNSRTYMFVDYWDSQWRYPNLEQEWMYVEQVWAFLLTAEDIEQLKNLREGEVVTVSTRFSNFLAKGNPEYSFPLFLRLTNTLYESGDTAPATVFTAKLVTDNGKQVVRFRPFPLAVVPELIDSDYFEIDYTAYLGLFEPDKTTKYK